MLINGPVFLSVSRSDNFCQLFAILSFFYLAFNLQVINWFLSNQRYVLKQKYVADTVRF